MNWLMLKVVRLYQLVLGPFLGGQCRFYPSCSNYSILCFRYLPFHTAFSLTVYRILRCNPWSDGGYDPPLRHEKDGSCHDLCELDLSRQNTNQTPKV